jgi:hypothetical protein
MIERVDYQPVGSKNMDKTTISIRSYVPAALILMIAGWGGFLAVINLTTPNGGTRWIFFFTAMVALTGMALPGIAFLNRRFPSLPPPTPAVIVRQAIWFGIYLPALAWLRLGNVLTFPLAILLALGLLMIEFLLRLRERSQWKPGQETEANTIREMNE